MTAHYLSLLKNVTTFLFDMDGVLTNGITIIDSDGSPVRNLNSKDGYAIQLAVKKGYHVAIISGGFSEPYRKRLLALGVNDVFMSTVNKMAVYEKFAAENKLSADQFVYMGDDIPDYEVMNTVGVAACPADAATELKSIAAYISSRKGGEGCVRDIIEKTMRLHGKWFNPAAGHNVIDYTW